jgi:hypothetical protein
VRRVILESPFVGDLKRNINYAKLAVRDSLMRGESPMAPHLLFPQPGILKDEVSEERKLGILAGLAWTEVAEAVVVYVDYGVSSDMMAGIQKANEENITVEFRKILTLS